MALACLSPEPATGGYHSAGECARYLTAKAPYLDYPTALAGGWPIATGIIETTRTYCEWK